MSRSELHNWECAIEKLSGDNADKMLAIAQDIYDTAFVRGKNYMTWKQQSCEDCISRKAVKDMLTAEWTKYMPMESDVNLSFVLEKISALPSVTPSYNGVKTELKPSEDCVSRAEAIKETKALFLRNFDSEYVVEMLKTLPSVTPQTRWIPCSEREAKYPCLACDKYGQIFIPIGVATIDGHSYDGLHFEFDAEKFLKGHPREIIAWMPLPEPYKEENNDADN